jgi:murein DD-endopeptidase MepM/ murein hydrolase activator NlpD
MPDESKMTENPLRFKISGLKSVPTKDRSLSSSNLSYQPNFILINQSNSTVGQALFGDILPFYSSYHELASVIVTTWESLYNFILQSNTFITCILSFFNQVVNSAAYQTYLAVTGVYDEVLALPNHYGGLKRRFQELVEALSSQETRELWWLELKLDIRGLLDRAISAMEVFWSVVQKFYLAVLVFVCLGILNLGGFSGQNPSSFLSNFVQNNTFSIVGQASTAITTPSLSQIAPLNTSNTPIQKIIEHTVGENQSVDQIAELYNVSIDTIKFNNSLESLDLKKDQKLYIPWIDGYIYNASRDISPFEISTFSGVDKDLIAKENYATLNPESGKFPKDTLVLVPVDNPGVDLPAIIAKIKAQADSTNQQSQRSENLSRRAVSSSTYLGVTASQARKNGFIWPTQGSISRCVQPGHIACDIANFSSPPIFAVQDGVVSNVSYYGVAGYGLMVLIDHGNGVKTLYAHMSEIYVTKGQVVKQGQSIGRMGETGWATGIHLHFEVVVGGVKQNPLVYLP